MNIFLTISPLDRNFIAYVIGFTIILFMMVTQSRKFQKWRKSRSSNEAVNEYDYIKQLVHSAPFALNAYIVLNSNGKIVNCNERTQRMLGWTEDELLGTTISKIIQDGNSSRNFEEFKKNKTTVPDDITIEIEGRNKLGAALPLEIAIGKWIDEDTKQWYFIVIMRDITHRKNTQKTQDDLLLYVQEIRKLYHEGEKIGGVAFWQMDCKTGLLEKYSPNFNHLFGIKGTEVPVDQLIKRVVSEDKVMLAETMVLAKEEKRGYSVQYRIATLDGYINTIYSIASATKNKKGELVSYIGMARLIKKEKAAWL